MTNGSVFGVLLQFSIPLICSSVLQLLFNAADVIVVGRFAGDNSLATVGSTTALINLLVNLFVGLSVGTTVVAANFFGSNRNDDLSQTVHTAILISFIALYFRLEYLNAYFSIDSSLLPSFTEASSIQSLNAP
mgnify:CR=1 FL=1